MNAGYADPEMHSSSTILFLGETQILVRASHRGNERERERARARVREYNARGGGEAGEEEEEEDDRRRRLALRASRRSAKE